MKKLIRATFDQYAEEERISAHAVHRNTWERQSANYQTPGYFLRMYRLRADLTQVALAQKIGIQKHHLSEMEHNKRALSKAITKKLAGVFDCDQRKFL